MRARGVGDPAIYRGRACAQKLREGLKKLIIHAFTLLEIYAQIESVCVCVCFGYKVRWRLAQLKFQKSFSLFKSGCVWWAPRVCLRNVLCGYWFLFSPFRTSHARVVHFIYRGHRVRVAELLYVYAGWGRGGGVCYKQSTENQLMCAWVDGEGATIRHERARCL